MDYSIFKIGKTPYCFWDWDRAKTNIEFIDSIDHAYFQYVAQTHIEHLSGDNKQRAAIALRINYFQALETFFSLMTGMLYSPSFIPGWMLKVWPENIRDIVRCIHKCDRIELPNAFGNEIVTWDDIAAKIFECAALNGTDKPKIISNFAQFWHRCASAYLDHRNTTEYNNLKHGLRAQPGGFELAIGFPSSDNSLPSPTKMKSLGGSEFGTSFLMPDKMAGEPPENKGLNYTLSKHSINWTPTALAHSLTLLSVSINNLKLFIKIILGLQHTDHMFIMPEQESCFDDANVCVGGVTHHSSSPMLSIKDIPLFTKKQILNTMSDEACRQKKVASQIICE